MMFAMISPVDMVVVVGVALVVFGPKRLPEVARQLGTFVREARTMMSQFTDSFEGMHHDVHSITSAGDNVMRPISPVAAPKLVPFDQRDSYAPPSLQPDAEHKITPIEESGPSLRLTDVSADREAAKQIEAVAAVPHSEQHRAADTITQSQEANKL